MAALTIQHPLDVYPGGVQKPVRLKQYSDDFEIVFSLYASRGEFTLESGTTAAIRGRKPDGNVYSEDAVIDIEGKTVTVTGDVQITAVSGRAFFEIVLENDGKELGSINCPFDIYDSAADKDDITSDSVVRELQAVMDQADEIIAAGEQYAEYKQAIDEAVEGVGDAKAAAEAAEDNARQYASNASDSADSASRSAGTAAGNANDANAYAGTAEAYAVGTRGGIPVGASDPAYHNNSKYYADQLDDLEIRVSGSTLVINYRQ